MRRRGKKILDSHKITVEKNLRNIDEIEFMDYLDAKLSDIRVRLYKSPNY
jgi:hypothetical protein